VDKKMVTVEKDEQLSYVVEEFVRYEAFHQPRFQKMVAIYDQWKNKPPKKDEDWQNNVVVPLTVEGEQTITPRIFTALFPTDAPIDIHVEGNTPPQDGIKVKGLIKHFFRVSDVQLQVQAPLAQNTLFGTGYVEGGTWFVKEGWTVDENNERFQTIIESRPDCKPVDFFEMFPHPAKLSIGDGLPIIRRRIIDAEALKKLADNKFFDTQKIQEALQTECPISSDSTILSPDGNYIKKPQDAYELLEYWGPWDESYVKSDGEVATRKALPYWIIVINRRIKIRAVPNPFNHQIEPYCKTTLFEDPIPSWFGVGIGEIGKSTQDRANKVVNQRLDNVDLVMNKQGFYNGNDTLINTKKLRISKPGQWHKVSDTVTSIRWMDTPDVTSSAYKEEELAKQDYREATGATAHLMPEAGSEHRTAMGIQLLQGAAGMRFRPVLRKLESQLIQQLAMFFFSNLKQFMAVDEWVEITGEDGQTEPLLVSPEDIQAKVFFIPTGISETMNKEIQVGQLLRFKEVTTNDPTVNRQEINKRIAELFGFKDIQKLLTPQNQGGGEAGGLTPEQKAMIDQRKAEGADSETIKQEMLGQPPAPQGGPQQ